MGVGLINADRHQCPIGIKIVSILMSMRECQYVEMDTG